MSSINHIHTYAKVKKSGGRYVRCLDPYCTHYCLMELVIGKVSKCTKCGEEIILGKKDFRGKMNPLCITNCANTKEALEFRKKRDTLDSLMGKL